MSYDAFETSRRAGRPVFLYRFTIGTQVYPYTSDAAAHTYLGDTYQPLENLQASGTGQSQEVNAQRITITATNDWIIPRLYVAFVPSLRMFLTIFKFHRAEPLNVYTYWQGFVRSAKFDDKNAAAVVCDPITVMFDRMGLRRTFAALCGHVLYDGFCPVPDSAFRVDGTLLAPPSGFTLSAAAWAGKPDLWFKVGFVERLALSGAVDTRFIINHIGTDITLLSPFPSDLIAGETLRAYAGCDHVFSTCGGKFGAYTDTGGAYGGYDRIPKKNPFNTGIDNVA